MPEFEQQDDGDMSTFSPAAKLKRGKKADESGSSKERPAPYNWSILTVAELVRFRDEINRTLPPTELSQLNLEQEMLTQYHTLRELQSDVLADDTVPANQRSQVANSVAAALKTLGDLQIALYNSERFKDVENALIRELSKLPEETAAAFLENYEKILVQHS